jgi:hypothetical protein
MTDQIIRDHSLRFVCRICKAEYRPQCLSWENASQELWSQGWVLCQRKNEQTALYGGPYLLHCAACVPIDIKNAAAFRGGAHAA